MGDPVPEEIEGGKNVVVYKDGTTTPSLTPGNYFVENPESTDANDYYPVVSRTEDIVYTLEIREYTPDEANEANGFTDKGIKYDQKVYTLVITLKNAPGGGADNIVDGIVDELDFKLYDCAAGDIKEETVPQATCETDQKVVDTFKDWAEADFTEFGGTGSSVKDWTPKWYYVNNSGDGDPVIREAKVEARDGDPETGTPTMFSVDIPDGSGYRTIHIVPDSYPGAAGNNDYFTFDEIKADGRDITFIAKREGHTDTIENGHTMTFSNTYAATGTWTPTINKTVEGREWQDEETFEFSLACTVWPGMGETGSLNYTYNPLKNESGGADVKTLTVKEGDDTENVGTGSFDKVTFTAPGTYEFTIKEAGTGMGLGKGSSSGEITLTVTATDNDDGTLTLAVKGKDGTTPPEGSDLGDTGTEVASTINFVNAYADGGEFTLAVAKTLTGKDWGTGEKFDFTINTEEWNGERWTPYSGSILTLPWTESTFSVSANEGTDGTRTHTLGKVQVGNLEGKEAKYRFTVTENIENFDSRNLYCAQPTIYLTVTVTPNPADGTDKIVATYAYLDSGEPVGTLPGDPLTLPFTNRYYVDTEAPGTEGEPADHGFTVVKSFTGRPDGNWLAGDTFTAKVTFSGDNSLLDDFQFKNESNYVTWNDTTYGTVEFSEKDQASKSFDFRFFAAGTYVFNVAETKGSIPGVKYDETKYTVTFTVTLTEANELEVTRAITGGSVTGGNIVFTNVYEPAHATWTPSVSKTLGGRDWVANDSFKFTLALTSGDTDGVTMPTDTKVTVTNKSEKVEGEYTEYKESFDPVTFTKAGTYTFTITESDPGRGIDEFSEPYEITATVTDHPDTGTLTVVVTQGGSTSTASDEAITTNTEFTNTYRQEQGKFTLAIQKTLEGRAWEAGESFTFTVTPGGDYSGKLIYPGDWPQSGGAYTVTVGKPTEGKTGKTTGEFKITEPGKYVFTIAETTGTDTYCPEPTITLTVNAVRTTEGGVPTGTMQVITTYATSDGHSNLVSPDKEGITTVPFINYAYAEADFTLHKELNGRNWGTGEEFHAEVELIKADLGGVELEDGPVVDKKTGQHLSEGGAITLAMKKEPDTTAEFRFLAAGTYTFEVTEVHGRLPGVTYDLSKYTVTVEVTANPATGALAAAKPVIQKNGVVETSISFHNDYDTVPITGGLTVTKTVLSGTPEVAAGPFTFTVTLDDTSVDGEYGGMTFTNGKATFDLYHGLSVTAVGLPAGTHYTVTEEEAADYTTASTGAQGTIPEKGVAEANFTNTAERVDPSTIEDVGGLVISTYVTGFGEKAKDWHFTVELSSVARAIENGPYDCVYYKDGGTPIAGKVTFTNGRLTHVDVDGIEHENLLVLQHGEHLVIYGLTPDETYTVHEVEEGQDGYVTSTVHTTGTIPHHSIASAVIVNDLEPEDIPVGSLTVYKTVAGEGADQEEAWPFTLTLSDRAGEPVNGTFNGVTFEDGNYTFTVVHGKHMTFTGLPEGYHYEVSENSAEGYTVSSTGENDTIRANVNATAHFVNTVSTTSPRAGNGLLTVTKTVTGNAGDHDQEFSFTVTLSGGVAGEPFNGGNTTTFTLKDGGSKTFELPAGTFYTVTEASAAGYTTTSTGSSETIREGQTSVASFVNDRTIATGNLTVTKTVTGDQGDRDREWSFQVELGRKLNGIYGSTKFTDGVADFTLKHGGSVTARNLPEGITYTVTEAEAGLEGYTTTATGASGTITGGTVQASFTNDRGELPPDDPQENPPDNPQENPLEDPSGNPPGGPSDSPSGNPAENTPGGQPDNPQGNSPVPKTGDNSCLGLWLTLMLLSLTGIAVILLPFIGKEQPGSRGGKRTRK